MLFIGQYDPWHKNINTGGECREWRVVLRASNYWGFRIEKAEHREGEAGSANLGPEGNVEYF